MSKLICCKWVYPSETENYPRQGMTKAIYYRSIYIWEVIEMTILISFGMGFLMLWLLIELYLHIQIYLMLREYKTELRDEIKELTKE